MQHGKDDQSLAYMFPYISIDPSITTKFLTAFTGFQFLIPNFSSTHF